MKQQISENGELKRFSITVLMYYSCIQKCSTKICTEDEFRFSDKKSINRKQTVIFFIYKDYKHKSNT